MHNTGEKTVIVFFFFLQGLWVGTDSTWQRGQKCQLDEVVNARPPFKSKADHQHPYDYKCVHYIHDRPSEKEEWMFLRHILDTHTVNTPQCQRLGKQSVQQRFLYWIFTYVTQPNNGFFFV